MKKTTLKDVRNQLRGLMVHFPESKHNNETINFISIGWLESFEGENVDDFNKAVSLSRKTCTFFPKECNIFEALERIKRIDEYGKSHERSCNCDDCMCSFKCKLKKPRVYCDYYSNPRV